MSQACGVDKCNRSQPLPPILNSNAGLKGVYDYLSHGVEVASKTRC
jgi:hypothetical protein